MLTLLVRIVDPLAMLKNPMILIGIVGFAFVIGMPYLMDNSMSPPFTDSPYSKIIHFSSLHIKSFGQ